MKWLNDMRQRVAERREQLDARAKQRRIDARAWELIRQGWPPSSAVDAARNEERDRARRAGLPLATAQKC